MGSYLEIDNRETNSKALSSILIEAVRFLDSNVIQNKKKKLFKAEYYNENNIGCGKYIISLEGMALLVSHFKDMCEDDEIAIKIGVESHEYFLTNLVKEEEMEEKINQFSASAKTDIRWCFDYVLEILIDMIILGNKRTVAIWKKNTIKIKRRISMLKRYFISYKYNSINGNKVIYAVNKEEAVSEFYKKCKYCMIEDNAELKIEERNIDNILLFSLDKTELIEIINKLIEC